MRARVAALELVARNARPEIARRPKLRNLLEEIVMGVPKERDAWRDVVERDPGFARGRKVGLTIGERKRDLFNSRGAGFANVIAGNGDGVPKRHLARAVRHDVGDQSHGRLGRVDVGPARDVFLEHVVLHGSAKFGKWNAAPARDGEIECQQDCGGCVDRH